MSLCAVPVFLVTHLDARQRVQQRRVEAVDVAAACGVLGLALPSVLSVQPQAARTERRTNPLIATARRFPLRLFSHELAVLLDAGIPLLEALQTLREKEVARHVALTLARVIEPLREGHSLSAGLRRAPQAFDALFIATVESSERTGQLATALRRHAAYLTWTETLRGKLIGAAIYPALLIATGVAVLTFLLVFVVPRFAGLLDGFRGELPLASRALLAVGAVGGAHPWLVIAAALSLLATPWLAWRSAAVRDAAARWAWRWPGIGPQLRLLQLALLYRTAGMLLAAGMPLVSSLQACGPLLNSSLRDALARATQAVRGGARLSDSLAAQGLCTPVSLRMLRVGERCGELGPMLDRAAAFHDEALLRMTELVTRLVNPLLMLVMGVVIGAVVVLMYLPIFQLAEQIP